MFKSTIFGSDYCWLANNNGCGQYALIGVRLLLEGGDYSRAASDRGNIGKFSLLKYFPFHWQIFSFKILVWYFFLINHSHTVLLLYLCQ